VTTVTLVLSGLAADVSYMVVGADLPDDVGCAVSPELVLVDAGLSAEVRHLLVVPEDTLERLDRDSGRRRRAPESGQHSTNSESETLQRAAPAPEPDDLVRRQDVASAGQVIEHVTPDESTQGQHASNTYPALPAPPPEYPQEDATDAVLRLITRSA
jgi:hypothetical protein